jgi:hypothetical protein
MENQILETGCTGEGDTFTRFMRDRLGSVQLRDENV